MNFSMPLFSLMTGELKQDGFYILSFKEWILKFLILFSGLNLKFDPALQILELIPKELEPILNTKQNIEM